VSSALRLFWGAWVGAMVAIVSGFPVAVVLDRHSAASSASKRAMMSIFAFSSVESKVMEHCESVARFDVNKRRCSTGSTDLEPRWKAMQSSHARSWFCQAAIESRESMWSSGALRLTITGSWVAAATSAYLSSPEACFTHSATMAWTEHSATR